MKLVEEWARANPRSRELHEQACRALPGGLTHDVRRAEPFPLTVDRAEGAHKWDADGHELVCHVMGHGALFFGHGHEAVVDAVRRQVGLFLHAGAGHELERAWAEQVVRLVPSAERVRFTSSGTEATLLALQVARASTGRPRAVRILGHFHGWHDYAAFGVDPPYDRRPPGVPEEVLRLVAVVPPDPAAVEHELAAGDVAAVLLEPSGAAWGAVPLPAGFLAAVRQLTRAHGSVLVFDEVVTGFRWAPGGVQQESGVVPDLTALAKILAGGLPGGALGGRAELMDVLDFAAASKVAHPGTHNAHPLSAAAGTVTLALLADGHGQAQAAARAAALREGLNGVLSRRSAPGLAYGQSSTFKLRLGVETATKESPSGALGDALQCGMLLHGVHLFHGDGFVGEAHADGDIERTIAAFEAVVPRLQEEGLLA
ncbi:MAG: aspartate aminotransferase family protein [Gaiellaceae bacterium]